MATIKSLPRCAFDRDLRAWLVPADDFEQVLALFPDASVDVDVWETVYPTMALRRQRVLTFCRSLAALGVSIVERDGRIVAVGDNVSPVLQAAVDERAEAIRRLLAEGWRFGPVGYGAAADRDAVGSLGDGVGSGDSENPDSTTGVGMGGALREERMWDIIVRGIANAREREARRQAMRRKIVRASVGDG